MCLFRQLPSVDTYEDPINTPKDIDPGLDLPLASDIIDSPISGVRVIHHNVQSLILKITEISHWLHGCDRDHVVFCSAVVRPG